MMKHIPNHDVMGGSSMFFACFLHVFWSCFLVEKNSGLSQITLRSVFWKGFKPPMGLDLQEKSYGTNEQLGYLSSTIQATKKMYVWKWEVQLQELQQWGYSPVWDTRKYHIKFALCIIMNIYMYMLYIYLYTYTSVSTIYGNGISTILVIHG